MMKISINRKFLLKKDQIHSFVPIWGTLRINSKSFQIGSPLQVPGPGVLFEAAIDNCKWCLRIRSLLDGARHRTTINRSYALRRIQFDWMGKQVHDSLSPKPYTLKPSTCSTHFLPGMQIVKKHQYEPSQQMRTSWIYVLGIQFCIQHWHFQNSRFWWYSGFSCRWNLGSRVEGFVKLWIPLWETITMKKSSKWW